MNCNECRDMLVEYSLGELSSEAMLRAAAHLDLPCPTCRQELAELNETLHALSTAIAPVEPPPGAKTELMDRVRVEQRTRTLAIADAPEEIPRPSRQWLRLLPYAAALAIAALLGSISARLWHADRVAQPDPREFNRRLDASRQLFHPPQLRLATFRAPHSAADLVDPPAYIVGDQLAAQWHIYAFDLLPPEPDRQLRLWFFTADGKWIRADKLTVQSDGTSSVVFTVPPDVEIVRAVISDEQDENATEPRGEILLTADLPPASE